MHGYLEMWITLWDSGRGIQGPFESHLLLLIQAGMNSHMPSKVWDEIIFKIPKFGDYTVQVLEW